jgi:PKD repeat protein
MKKTLFTLLLLAVAIFGLNAQTYFVVHGTVNNLNGQPVNGHQVFIASDSLNNPSGWNFFNMVYTNPNGYFMDTVPFVGGTNMAFRIYTFDCNQMIHDTLVFSGAQQGMIEFNICDQVTPGCQAAFQAYTDSAGTHFIDYSVGIITHWGWDFGDGGATIITFPQNPNVTHQYGASGTYTVTLSVWSDDSLGCRSTWSDNIIVGNVPGCQAAFQAYTDSAGTHFTDYSAGNITQWAWDFGDPAAGIANNSTLQNPTHTYSLPGVYMVCLTVSSGDSLGCTSTWCDYINIGNAPGCQAAFQAYPDSSETLAYQFIDYSVGNNLNWAWNFGDPASGIMNFTTVQNPTHTFSSPGVYTVCLTITSADSTWCTNTWCDTIVVGNVPNCSNYFTYTTSQLTASFTGTAIGYTNPTYTWGFGDGSAGTGQYATHTYATTGYYIVILTTTGDPSFGCTYSSTQQIYVGQQGDMIWGQVTAGNSFADQARVLLYANSNNGTNNFILIDSTFVDSIGYYRFYNLNYNLYFLKAELFPASVYYGEYMPTYFDSAMYWNEATGIVPWQPNNQYNIGLLPADGITNTGNGAINGTVTYGSGKGPMAPGVEVILLDAEGNPLAYTYTDNSGWFSFADLGYDTYSVYVEIPGMTTMPASATLNATNPTASMSFVIGDNSIYLSAIEKLPEGFKAIGQVFPNPSKGEAAIMINLEKTITFDITIIDFTGKHVSASSHNLASGQHKLVIDLQELPTGVYAIMMRTQNGAGALRKLMVVK